MTTELKPEPEPNTAVDSGATDTFLRESEISNIPHTITEQNPIIVGLPNGNTMESLYAIHLDDYDIPAHVFADDQLMASLLAPADFTSKGYVVSVGQGESAIGQKI